MEESLSLGMSPRQTAEMIKEWLEDDGYVIDTAGLTNTDFGWQFKASGQRLYLLKLKNRANVLVVSGSIILGKNKKSILESPSTPNLFHELSMKYLELGLDYFFRPELNNLNLIELCKHIHYDKLSKNELSLTVNLIRNIVIWTQKKIERDLFGITNNIKPDSVNSPITEGMPSDWN